MFKIKQNDTLPNLVANLKTATGVALSLANSEVRFYMVSQDDFTTVKVNSLATISNATLGTVTYEWSSGDTNLIGNFYGEFEVRYNNGRILSVPTENYIPIKIYNDIN